MRSSRLLLEVGHDDDHPEVDHPDDDEDHPDDDNHHHNGDYAFASSSMYDDVYNHYDHHHLNHGHFKNDVKLSEEWFWGV